MCQMEQSDQELIKAYLDGEEVAFNKIVKRYLSYVYSFAYRLSGNKDEAEDITQDTFFKVWKNLKNYSGETAGFKTWLSHIARNTAIDYLRKKKPVLFSDFETEAGDNFLTGSIADSLLLPDQLAMDRENEAVLEEAIKKLPLIYREVVVLYHGSNLSLNEVSEFLGLPVNTVKSRYRRATDLLKKIIDAPKAT